MRWFVYSAIAAALTLTAGAESVDWSTVVQRNVSAVIVTYAEKDGSTAQGSGVCIGNSGFVLATAHQIEDARRIMGRGQRGGSFDLRLVDKDSKLDIALLQSSKPFEQCVVIGNAQTLSLGAALLGITSPKNLEFSATDGILSARRLFRGNEILQTSIPFAEGSSGGPVFDQEGLLVGFVYGQVADFPGATLVYPINNAYALLRNHNVDVPERSVQIHQPATELIEPVEGLSRNERSAINFYNSGVNAASPDEKVRNFLLATKWQPGFFEAWFNLGAAMSAQGNFEEAVLAYEHALQLRENDRDVLRNLGLLHLELNQFDDAEKYFLRIKALAPLEARSYNDLGETYRRASKFEQAKSNFMKAIELEPDYHLAVYNLAITLEQLGEIRQAIESYEHYLNLQPEAPDAAETRALIAYLKTAGTESSTP